LQLTPKQLTGFDASNLVELPQILACKAHQQTHPDALAPLLALADEAREAGVAFKVVSSYRSFDQQLAIWNAKVSGSRAILTKDNQTLDPANCSPEALIEAIMYYSALPGASRHHWGSEFDIFPSAALESDYQVQLTPEEFATGGIASELGCWLNQTLPHHGFFRPYERYQQGVAQEPWHLSYQPVSSLAMEQLSLPLLTETIRQQVGLALQSDILKLLPNLYQNYIVNICD
jgi:LAS superfamily LD-carboxypeptidase LdcB